MKKINIEVILKNCIHQQIVEEDGQSERYFETMWLIWWGMMDTNIKNGIGAAFKKAIEEVLKLAAENARLTSVIADYGGGDNEYFSVEKQSILDTSKQVEYE